GGERMLAGALYYMVGSTAAVSALFLLAEALEREPEPEDQGDDEGEIADPLSLYWGPMGLGAVDDDDEPAVTLRASVVAMGASFMVLVAALAGLPPFSGFIGKFAMVSGMLSELQIPGGGYSWLVWAFIIMLFVSGFSILMSLLRFGIARFWTSQGDGMRMLALEIAPVALLIGFLALLAIQAQPVMRYAQSAAAELLDPAAYAQSVLRAEPAPIQTEPPAAASEPATAEPYNAGGRDELGTSSPPPTRQIILDPQATATAPDPAELAAMPADDPSQPEREVQR
ncbi:MAG: hypothetical protein Q4G36_04090, partial [Paracoccus sp. (in: a-proteobacteria)]|nr:hypothetical protein [Paracoccus sp. (in: a-proteobacteria)]